MLYPTPGAGCTVLNYEAAFWARTLDHDHQVVTGGTAVKLTSLLAPACVATISLLAVTGCSRSPVAPEHPAATVSNGPAAAAETSAQGTYEILFLKSTLQGLQPVVNHTLNVGESLALKSRITDINGVPAVSGTVTYDYCERQNVKVPSAECESGRARWTRFWSMSVDPAGSLLHFGRCSTPRTIGFRVRYNGQSGGIASGVSAAKDVSWQ